ncbi:MAG: PIN domain-containing protein [Nitrospirae bacterium]|nr:PIN domain-containing protein [Nitrospirota bacterium]
MIYLDSSVLLAELFAEDRAPEPGFWQLPTVSSRLLEYEAWVNVNLRNLASTHGKRLLELMDGVEFVELHPLSLARALEPFPRPVRTLDALHLATAHFIREQGSSIEFATYDRVQAEAARALKFTVLEP